MTMLSFQAKYYSVDFPSLALQIVQLCVMHIFSSTGPEFVHATTDIPTMPGIFVIYSTLVGTGNHPIMPRSRHASPYCSQVQVTMGGLNSNTIDDSAA